MDTRITKEINIQNRDDSPHLQPKIEDQIKYMNEGLFDQGTKYDIKNKMIKTLVKEWTKKI